MFERSGKGIKTIADIIFGISILIGLFLLVRSIAEDSLLLGLITGCAVALGGYIQGLFLSAFGELVESNEEILKANRDILEKLEKMSK